MQFWYNMIFMCLYNKSLQINGMRINEIVKQKDTKTVENFTFSYSSFLLKKFQFNVVNRSFSSYQTRRNTQFPLLWPWCVQEKSIFHGRIGLYNVPSFSNLPDVVNGAMLMLRLHYVSRFKEDHMTSVLEGSPDLCGIQGQL